MVGFTPRAWVSLGLICAICSPSVASAQQEQQRVEPDRGLTLERRQELYDIAKLDHRVALKRSAILPGWGNLYADNVPVGMLFMSGAGMSVFLLGGGLLRDDTIFTVVGAVGLAGCYAGSLVTSYRGVSKYNDNLRARYKVDLNVSPTQGGAAAALTLRF